MCDKHHITASAAVGAPARFTVASWRTKARNGGIDSTPAPASASLPRRLRAALAAAQDGHGLRGAGGHRRDQCRQGRYALRPCRPCQCRHGGNRHFVRRTRRRTDPHTRPSPGRVSVGAVAGAQRRSTAAGVSALARAADTPLRSHSLRAPRLPGKIRLARGKRPAATAITGLAAPFIAIPRAAPARLPVAWVKWAIGRPILLSLP